MKRIILLQFILLVVLQLAAQTKTVTIHGIVKDTSLKSIELSYVVDATLTKFENTKLDVRNGTFITSIQIPFPIELVITYGHRYFSRYISSDVEILIDSAGEPHMIGSAMQDEYENEFLPFFQSTIGFLIQPYLFTQGIIKSMAMIFRESLKTVAIL